MEVEICDYEQRYENNRAGYRMWSEKMSYGDAADWKDSGDEYLENISELEKLTIEFKAAVIRTETLPEQ